MEMGTRALLPLRNHIRARSQLERTPLGSLQLVMLVKASPLQVTTAPLPDNGHGQQKRRLP